MSYRPVSPLAPGEASPTFAELAPDDSDNDGDGDPRSEAGGPEAYELVSERDTSREREGGRVDEALIGRRRRRRRRPSASSQPYSPDEDSAVRRKFDRRLVLFVALLYMLSFLDRSSTCPTRPDDAGHAH